MSNMPPKARRSDMERYRESCKTEFWGRVFEEEARYITRSLRGQKTLLSIGCGPVAVERKLQEAGFEVTGLDVSREALGGADFLRTVVGSAEEMPFADSSFDSAISVASLQFIDDYEKAIQGVARVLKPKGKFLAMLLNPESSFFKERRRRPDSYVSRIRHQDFGEMKKAMRGCFSIEKAEYFLGITGDKIFGSTDQAYAALYVLIGVKSGLRPRIVANSRQGSLH
jgi:SAM-dependent methyltransferase